MTVFKKNALTQKKEIFSAEFVLIYIFMLFFALISANPFITFYSFAVIPVIVFLLWRKEEPPIFVFTSMYQWLQASVKIFHANMYNEPLKYFQKYEGTEQAIWLSITGVVVLSAGIRLILNNIKVISDKEIRKELKVFSINRLFFTYIIIFVAVVFLDKIKFYFLQFSQIIVSVMQIKWAIFFILIVKILKEGEKKYYIISIIFLEVIIGFSGYFADFKEVFFFFFVTFLTVRYHIEIKSVLPLAIAFVLLFFLAVFWTSIKDEYRTFVRAGSSAQVVRVSNSQKIKKFKELWNNFTKEHFAIAFNAMLERIAYVDFFGATIDYVPFYRKHTNGAVWATSVKHILMPRLLFPDKKILPSDSEHTMKYTGIILASTEQGASFSIGYMGDSYIDFGIYGMFIPIFFLGLLWGGIYKLFLLKSKYKLLGLSFATVVIMNTYQLERASVKLLGVVLMSFLVTFLFMLIMQRTIFLFLVPAEARKELIRREKKRERRKINNGL